MKRIILITLLLIAASAPAFAQTASGANSKAEQEVLKTLDEVLRAMIEHDMAAIDRLWCSCGLTWASTCRKLGRRTPSWR